MANKVYDNFFLSNEVEDQYNSHLDLNPFITVDNTLVGTAGMERRVNVYSATNGTEKLTMGQGNTKSIEVGFSPKKYNILMAQNRFDYFDEEEMTDPIIVPVGMKHAGVDLYNTVQGDIYGEYFVKNEAGKYLANQVENASYGFDAFADAVATLNIDEKFEGLEIFSFVSRNDMAKLRKGLKDELKYVEAFARNGYVGTVAGVNIYTKKDAKDGEIVVATREAITIFNKKGVEVAKAREENIRKNSIFTRKYYVTALTDATKVAIISMAQG